MTVHTDQGVIPMLRETVRFKRKGQVTIPKSMVEELGLREDDLLEARLEEGKIVLVPAITIPKDQAWYWTEEWQKEEKEADEDIAQGRVTGPMKPDEALEFLDRLIKDE